MSTLPFRAAESATLLDYRVFTQPDPLQAGATDAILTLVASNPGGQTVTVQRLAVTLPVGTAAHDLTPDATGVQVQLPDGWSAAATAGVITLMADGPAARIGGDGISFILSALTVNAQVGVAVIALDETASTAAQPAVDRAATIRLPKFPTQFHVSDLAASPLDVPSGGSTTLMWAGSPAQYTLTYQPADQGTPVSAAVGSTGPFTAHGLTRAGQVTFTLVVQVVVPGFDQPLMVQRNASVSVETLSASLAAIPPVVGVNGLTCVSWQAGNATRCRLDPAPGAVATHGSVYLLLQAGRTFTLTAWGADGSVVQRQVSVAVDPTIVPNTPGFTVAGAPGATGKAGDGWPGWTSPGGPGGPGADAVLTRSVPPIDPGAAPARVIPVVLTGGKGGTGGAGGTDHGSWGHIIAAGGNGGVGGRGGDVRLALTFDPTAGPPAQYVMTLTPGSGGGGGPPGSAPGIPPGAPGAPGGTGAIATFSFQNVT